MVDVLRPVTADADELAGWLINEFGSLAAVLAGERSRLTEALDGNTEIAEYLLMIRKAMRHGLRSRIEHRPLLSSSRTLFAYLRLEMAHKPIEQLRILYLSVQNELVADELAATGDVDSVAIDADTISSRARSLGAASVILAHNHPSGDRTPSRQDIAQTKAFALTALGYGVRLLDHIVVSRGGVSSFRALGLLQPDDLCN